MRLWSGMARAAKIWLRAKIRPVTQARMATRRAEKSSAPGRGIPAVRWARGLVGGAMMFMMRSIQRATGGCKKFFGGQLRFDGQRGR